MPPSSEGARSDEELPDIDTLASMIEHSSYSDQLSDPRQMQLLLFEKLAELDDPILREIGLQLRDGLMGLQAIVGVDAYWQHVTDGLAGLEDGVKLGEGMLGAQRTG
jgi:hypothetical protein